MGRARIAARWLAPAAFGIVAALGPLLATADGPMTRAEAFARAAALVEIGRAMFFDPALSASGAQSCASCHDPAHAFGPVDASPVVLGGPGLDRPGVRAVPSLRYLQSSPPFTEHYFDSPDEADESVDNGPTGGLTWDGRADRARDQARIPLFSPDEMANADAAAVVAALARSSYADRFRALAGVDVFDRPDEVFAAALDALAAFEQDPETFAPYSSRYDAWLAGRGTLTAQEARGLALFDDPAKGNCASCHVSGLANDGEPPVFSDFGLLAIGLPRNPAIPANADPGYFDLGACGPYRTDLAGRADACGLFRTPTLRNVALRRSFFHNGVVHSLREAVAFYATRDSDPGRWYPVSASDTVAIYDDLPAVYRENLDMDPPFGGEPGDPPALTEAEIDDIVAFLGTLTDADLVPAGSGP